MDTIEFINSGLFQFLKTTILILLFIGLRALFGCYKSNSDSENEVNDAEN